LRKKIEHFYISFVKLYFRDITLIFYFYWFTHFRFNNNNKTSLLLVIFLALVVRAHCC